MGKRPVVFALVAVCMLILLGHCYAFRVKRRLDEFGEMILLMSNRNPMDFNGYGNWCGFGGKGETVDAIDGCCKVHDKCYAHINRDECQTMLKYKVYTTEYRWSFKNDVITCRDDDVCAQELCECDRAAATCFGQNQDVYDTGNKHSGIVKGLSRLLGMNS